MLEDFDETAMTVPRTAPVIPEIPYLPYHGTIPCGKEIAKAHVG